MANEVRIHTSVSGNAGKEVRSLSDAWTTFQKKGASGLGIGVGIAASAKAFSLLDTAMSSAVEGIGSSVQAASDLNETMTKSEVIFGNNSDAVKTWAKTMATASGQSQRAALDAASGFAGLFKTVGMGIDESTTMAKKLTELGSDLASFFNTDVESALGALKSGLNGESEPLRRFNVFLSETAVSAKLAAMGVEKVAGKFTEAQKATARYALILEQTGDAQGDFARTSDGLANSTRTLDSKMENLQARLGGALLPVVEKGTDTFLLMADAIDAATDSEASFEDRLGGVTDILNHINPLTLSYTLAMDDVKAKQEAAAEATENAGKTALRSAHAHQAAASDIDSALDKAGVAFTDLSDEGRGAAAALKIVMHSIVTAAQKTRDDLADIGSRTADVLFDPLIAASDYAATKREIDDTRAIISSKRQVGETVAEHKREVEEAKARLLELSKTAFEQQVALIGWGKLNAKEQTKFLGELKTQWASATGEAKQDLAELIAYIEGLHPTLRLTVGVTGAGGAGRRGAERGAETGGFVPAGDLSWVGEGGKKELIEALPGGGVVVHPMDGGAYGLGTGSSGGGQPAPGPVPAGGTTINVNVQGLVRAETPEDIGRVLRRVASFGLAGSVG